MYTTCLQLYVSSLSRDKHYKLQTHVKDKGLVPRKLESGGRNKNALTYADICNVRNFILTYGEAHAVHLPGRVPGFKRTDVQLLPSEYPISAIFKVYQQSASAGQWLCIFSSSFRPQYFIMTIDSQNQNDREKPENWIICENRGLSVTEKTLVCYKRDI